MVTMHVTPPRPKLPASPVKWNQMLEVNEKLRKQNQAIIDAEIERNDVYMGVSAPIISIIFTNSLKGVEYSEK